MKALIIREPWISLILDGRKTWEMRSKNLNYRGPIGLIRQGSGTVVGIVRVVDCLAPLSEIQYAAAFERHRVPRAQQAAAFERGWRVPWVLEGVRALARPVRYRHKSGAQSWVVLSEDEAAAVAAQADAPAPAAAAPTRPAESSRSTAPSVCTTLPMQSPQPNDVTLPPEGLISAALSTLTGDNIRNGHINLRPCRDLFPADAFGGSNRAQASLHPITVTFDPGETVQTDIAGDKVLLRERGAVRDFLERTGAQEGDRVRIERLAPRRYRFSLASRVEGERL